MGAKSPIYIPVAVSLIYLSVSTARVQLQPSTVDGTEIEKKPEQNGLRVQRCLHLFVTPTSREGERPRVAASTTSQSAGPLSFSRPYVASNREAATSRPRLKGKQLALPSWKSRGSGTHQNMFLHAGMKRVVVGGGGSCTLQLVSIFGVRSQFQHKYMP